MAASFRSPTANLGIDHRIAIPHDGVYAGWLNRADGARSMAAISVGTNPTFDGVARRVEAYVIDEGHDLELYDEHVVVEFETRLRGMERFDSIEDLVEQMTRDVDDARSARRRSRKRKRNGEQLAQINPFAGPRRLICASLATCG